MVRRGGRSTAPLSTSKNSSTSSSNGSSGTRWSRSRPNSANSGEMIFTIKECTKSFDSSRSSPNASSQSFQMSPPAGKKGNDRGGKGRSSSNWRSRGSGNNRGAVGAAASDSKFSITNEDFPALPGARGGSQSTPNKGARKDRDSSGKLGLTSSTTEMCVTDDSGVSSSSRGHTPVQDKISPPAISTAIVKGIISDMRKKPLLLPSENMKRRAIPADRERPTRSGPKTIRSVMQPPFSSASPKKKSINAANSANTAPSFMKLSKLGQKIPERRGGTRVSNQSAPTTGPLSPSGEDSGKENEGKSEEDAKARQAPTSVLLVVTEKPKLESLIELGIEEVKPTSVVPPKTYSIPQLRNQNYPPSNVPKIVLGPDGEMSNIPSSMLTDAFGMAAMLPILDIVKKKSNTTYESECTQQQKKDRSLCENIEMITIGMDLNELGVPIKTAENRSVWQSFAGPFGTEPLAPTSVGLSYYQVPSVYYTARTLQSSFDMTQNIPDKFGVYELFYIFYNLPKELWQLNAARELQYRGWRFNIKERLWVHKKLGEPDEYGITVQATESVFTQPGSHNQEDVMIGIFEIYDAEKARITSREMCLRRSDFEVPAWEQTVLDDYQKMVHEKMPKEILWGPREDRIKISGIPGMAGLVSAGAGRNSTNKLANLVIPKQQPPPRRLLSFADSPNTTPSFDNPFGTLPGSSAGEDLYRQQMYSVIMQKMQMQQQQSQAQQAQTQQLRSSATPGSLPSSSSTSSFFQP